jgi:hypothetical protein
MNSKHQAAPRVQRGIAATVAGQKIVATICLITLFSLSSSLLNAQSEAVDVGYRDHDYGTTVTPAPTGEKPESKLWFHDGYWWASMWDPSAGSYMIYRFDWPNQTFINTGVALDDRPSSKADVLCDDNTLYVASHIFTTYSPDADPGEEGRLYRYTYNPASQTYSADDGFPVNVNSDITETLVLDKDSTGKLWVTWTRQGKVYVNCSAGDDQTWGTPIELTGLGNDVDTDDTKTRM